MSCWSLCYNVLCRRIIAITFFCGMMFLMSESKESKIQRIILLPRGTEKIPIISPHNLIEHVRPGDMMICFHLLPSFYCMHRSASRFIPLPRWLASPLITLQRSFIHTYLAYISNDLSNDPINNPPTHQPLYDEHSTDKRRPPKSRRPVDSSNAPGRLQR
jgi:hypothetical protein